MAIALANEAHPEDAVATDERIRTDLARLLQARLVRESTLGVWVHPVLIAVVVALAWPDAPHNLLIGWGSAVVITTLVRGAWLYVSARRALSEQAVRTGVRSTVSGFPKSTKTQRSTSIFVPSCPGGSILGR